MNRCVTCKKNHERIDVTVHQRYTNKDGVTREYYRCYGCSKFLSKDWDQRNKARKNKTHKEAQKRNYSKYVSRWKVYGAIKSGKVKKGKCVGCKSVETQAHHEDYSKPLEVIWMCAKCHARHHKLERLTKIT